MIFLFKRYLLELPNAMSSFVSRADLLARLG